MGETFKVGDLVYRPKDVYDDESPIMKGVVVNVRYNIPPGPYVEGPSYPVLIDVEWDGDNRISYGYLPHGITKNLKKLEGERNGYRKSS